MGEIREGTPKFSPFVMHIVTREERERYRDSPTQSILKTPTAIFTTAEDLNRSGKRLTFADSDECDRESSVESQKKASIQNGGGEKKAIEIAVSPIKAIRVSPEAWKAHIAYRRSFQDYPNETEKTDYTYSRLSPFHNREILPGIPMRPNMSRPALRAIYSAPSTRCSTPVTRRRFATSAAYSSPFVRALTDRIDGWKKTSSLLQRQTSFEAKEAIQRKTWWWLLLLLLFIGLWSISRPAPLSPVHKISATSPNQVLQLLERLRAVEMAVAEEVRKRRNVHLKQLQQAIQMDRARARYLGVASRRCCDVARLKMLEARYRLRQEIEQAALRIQMVAEEKMSRLHKHVEQEVSQLRRNWTVELTELRAAIASETSESYVEPASIHRIIAETLRRYDADKTGLADYALESGGGRVVGIRCTQPWPTLPGRSFDPQVAIRRGVAPGECWAFQGEGRLVIELSHDIHVSGCSIEHIPSVLHPHGHPASAPKSFKLLGLKSEDDVTAHLFGSYVYQIGPEVETVQQFPVTHPANAYFRLVELVISSNHGHPYTCLYRVRVHGNLAL